MSESEQAARVARAKELLRETVNELYPLDAAMATGDPTRVMEAAQQMWIEKACTEPMTDWTVPPGALLAEKLAEIERTAQDLAEGTGLDLDWIEGFLAGKAVLVEKTAVALEPWTQIPARTWMRWERLYREDLAAGKTVVAS